MAPIGGPTGGGQAGFGSGGSFTGPSEALELVGDHAYAYTNVPASTTSVNAFNFTSGNYYFVGKIQLNPELEYANGSTGSCRIRIKMNGSIVGLLITEATDFYRSSMNLIIPAYTSVTVEVVSAEDTPAEIITIGLTGRIYR